MEIIGDNSEDTKIVFSGDSSFRALLLLALFKDLLRLLQICGFVIGIIILFKIFFLFVPYPPNLTLFINYNFPKAVILILIIWMITSLTVKVLCRLVSPRYTLTTSSLLYFPRKIRIFTDPVYQRIDLSKVKNIWIIHTPFDSLLGKEVKILLLGIELANSQFSPNPPMQSSNKPLLKALLRMWSGSLSFKFIYGIKQEEEFINFIKLPPQDAYVNLLDIWSLIFWHDILVY